MTRSLPKAAALLPFLLAAAGAPAPASTDPRSSLAASPRSADAPTKAALELPTATPALEFGPYRVLRKLGSGGMGSVYLAESERPVRRRVALKVVGEGLFAPRLFQQFEVEQQALAKLEHENIARLYECGASADGRPWMAMEWVDGEELTAYCDRRELPLDKRLELFATLARAVEHMHERGVLHGDLKPENVLVTERNGKPTPKIIDLGLARLSGVAIEDTEIVMGTPAYMAPEHFALGGPALDERSDVFALGVLLRDLLVGTAKPQPGNGVAQHWMLAPRALPSQALPSGSARRAARGGRELLARLRGGLDSVVGRATALEVHARTSSAAELAGQVEADVERASQRQVLRRAWIAIGAAATLGAALGGVMTAAL